MKFTCLLLFALIIVSLLAGEETFVFDITRFYCSHGISEVEIPFEIPHDALSYQDEHDTLVAPFRVIISFENLDTDEVLFDTLDRRSIIPSMKEAKERDLVALEEFRMYFKAGHYRMSMNVIDVNTGKRMTKSEIFSIDSLPKELTISDIKFATSIESDSTEGRFSKNGLRIIPNPSGIFGYQRTTMYYYFEVYNLYANDKPYEIYFSIFDEQGKILNKLSPKEKHKGEKGTIGIDIGALNVIAFKPGEYVLKIEVKDGDVSSYSEKRFTIIKKKPVTAVVISFFTEEEKKFYNKIAYIASSSELKEFTALSDTGKVAFLRRFWGRRDPNPATVENEALVEFMSRVLYVEDRFSTPFKKGFDTDRGRIYIKYGSPDSEDRYHFETDYKPYEIWEYFSYGGYKFIFSDWGGDGEFLLVYSSTPKEPSFPNWRKLVPADVGIMHGN